MVDAPLTSLVIGPDDQRAVQQHLDQFLSESNLRQLMVLDRSGQVIATCGTPPAGNLLTLCALLAGTFASAREVARALDEPDLDVFFQQGTHVSVLTQLVGEHWLLVALFGPETPLGLVKLMARRAAKDLSGVLDRVRGLSRSGASQVTPQLKSSLEETIDNLFKD